jgi:class 3 adenylate cyclase
LSEQILKSPKQIGQLIDRWSRHVVDIIWETGGVFDKMDGDCIIGLWGPPFYDSTATERCHAAVDASRRIRDYTSALATDPQFSELRGHDFQMNVATGVNYCPMFVGLFGPDESFTGFSSGMNNAARLQGVAEAGEVLCMERVVTELDDYQLFGTVQSATVKNVAEPLHYRVLT